jgi:parallel beta-helix repeat protein
MAWDDDAYYETELEIPSGRYGKLIAIPGGPGPSGPPGPQGDVGPAGPPGPAEGVEFQINKGVPSGYAPLGADGLVPSAHLPASTGGGVDTMAELADVTATGLAVGTAVDEKAARTAILAQRTHMFDARDFGAVGDGVADDTVAVQAALDAAKVAAGGVVLLPQGTYLISAMLRMNGANVTLTGSGRSATIIKTVGDHQLIAAQAAGLCIRDLQLLGDADAAKTLQRGIEGQNLVTSLIHNVHVKNMGYDGICMLNGCADNTISACLVTGSQDDGINLGGGTLAPSPGNTVTGCVVRDVAHTGIHISGNSSYTSVTGNTISNCGYAGIDTFQFATAIGLGGHTIVGNTVRDCALWGIHIKDSDYNVVSGNTVKGSAEGFSAENTHFTEFTGNTCSAPTVNGLIVDGASSDLVIANNVFSGANAKVLINGPRSVIRGNRVAGLTSTAVSVAVAGAVDCVIEGNGVSSSGGYGINTVAARSIISNNRVSAGSSAIRLSAGANESVVTSNIVTGGSTGVEVSGSTSDCVLSSNVLNGQTTAGVSLNTAIRTQIHGNRISSALRGINLTAAVDTTVSNNVTVSSGANGAITENTASTGTVLLHNRFDGAVLLNGANPVYREAGVDFINNGPEYTSSTNYQRSVWKQNKAILTAMSGATVTATDLIPDGALLLGVTARINTTVTGATGFTIGDTADPDLWGAVVGVAAGKATTAAGFTAANAAGVFYPAAGSVTLTATGGTFTAGEVELVAHYMTCEAKGSVALNLIGDAAEDLGSITTLEGESPAATLEGVIPAQPKKRAPRKKTT